MHSRVGHIWLRWLVWRTSSGHQLCFLRSEASCRGCAWCARGGPWQEAGAPRHHLSRHSNNTIKGTSNFQIASVRFAAYCTMALNAHSKAASGLETSKTKDLALRCQIKETAQLFIHESVRLQRKDIRQCARNCKGGDHAVAPRPP